MVPKRKSNTCNVYSYLHFISKIYTLTLPEVQAAVPSSSPLSQAQDVWRALNSGTSGTIPCSWISCISCLKRRGESYYQLPNKIMRVAFPSETFVPHPLVGDARTAADPTDCSSSHSMQGLWYGRKPLGAVVRHPLSGLSAVGWNTP